MKDARTLAPSLKWALKDDGIDAEVETMLCHYALISTPLGFLRIGVKGSTVKVAADLKGTDLSGIALIASTADLWLTSLEQ